MASTPPPPKHPLEEEFRVQEEKEQESKKETSLTSTMLESVVYEEGVLVITFLSGSTIEVPGTELEYEDLVRAPSPGSYMWAKYPELMHTGKTGELE